MMATGRSQQFVVTSRKEQAVPSPDAAHKNHTRSTDTSFIHRRYEDTALVIFQQHLKTQKQASPGFYKVRSSDTAHPTLKDSSRRGQKPSSELSTYGHTSDSIHPGASPRLGLRSRPSQDYGSSPQNSVDLPRFDGAASSSTSSSVKNYVPGIESVTSHADDVSLVSDNSSVAASDVGSDVTQGSAGHHNETWDSGSQTSSAASSFSGKRAQTYPKARSASDRVGEPQTGQAASHNGAPRNGSPRTNVPEDCVTPVSPGHVTDVSKSVSLKEGVDDENSSVDNDVEVLITRL